MPRTDLQRIPLFGGIAQDERNTLGSDTLVRNLPKNTVIVHEGGPGGFLYILLAGKVNFFVTGENGREFVFGTAGPQEYLGEISLDGGPRSPSVMTLEPCRCAVVPGEPLRSSVARHPGVALAMVRNLISCVGASRQMASRILNDLSAGGYLARRGRRLDVLRRSPRAA